MIYQPLQFPRRQLQQINVAILSLFVVLTTGCASGVATLQPASVLPAGKFEASAGMAVHVPVENTVRIVEDAVNTVKSRYEGDASYKPTADDEKAIIQSGAAMIFNPIAVQNEFAARVGVGANFDVGLRLSGKSYHAQGKYQFLRAEDSGWDASIVGDLHYLSASTAFSVAGYNFAEFKTHRFGTNVSMLFGKKFNDIGYFWTGPRYQLDHTSFDVEIMNGKGSAGVSANGQLFGAVVGGAVGYKWIYFMTEITGGYVYSRPEIVGTKLNTGGLLLVPAFGLLGRFP
jgi:hypothetical protein